MTNPWTVPLPTHMETIVRLVIPNSNGDISKTASVHTLITGYAGLKFYLCFEKDQGGLQPCDVVRLALNGSELAVINATAINLLKYCFATVLRPAQRQLYDHVFDGWQMSHKVLQEKLSFRRSMASEWGSKIARAK
ncbi:hypothetical protein K4K56_001848 [Colletotrichum sp. SAR 10_98]|nr:hypothetical protein K4K56_001848 [Colletotrichum sp. SAR 10_98]